jgi:hypothetical protein
MPAFLIADRLRQRRDGAALGRGLREMPTAASACARAPMSQTGWVCQVIPDTSQATAAELRASWNPMMANAGVYEVAGNLLTIRPIAAKIPVVMKPGAYEVYGLHVGDNTLTLTQQRNVRGPVEGRAPTKVVRLE